MENKILILIRGLPGSGKSTLASLIKKDNWFHHETDEFYMNDGQYVFDPTLLRTAHQWNQDRTEREMSKGHSGIVSNTFTTHAEMKPYISLAKKYGYKVSIIVAQGDYGSVHNVPAFVLKKMKDRWED